MAHLDPEAAGGVEVENDIDIARLVRMIWRGRVTVIVVTGITTVLTIIYLHTVTFSYSATLTLVPTQGQSQGIASQFGGLAAMAGINLPTTQGSSPFTIYTDTLGSRGVADEVLRRDPRILQRLLRYEWNDDAHRWEEPSGLRHTIAGMVKPLLGLPVIKWTAPSSADLQEYIAQSVMSASDPKKSLITMTYFNPDPVFASYFLQLVHGATDDVLRKMTLDRAVKYARYLEDKLPTTQTTDLRQILVQSLSQQETIIMMGSSDTSFAAQPLGVPMVSLFPVKPRGLYILLAGILAGMALGSFLAIRGISAATLWSGLLRLAHRVRR